MGEAVVKAEIDVEVGQELRSRFPYFSPERGVPDAAYLDSAASALKLGGTVERLSEYLSYEHSNIHRGAYALSANASLLFEEARQTVRRYFQVPDDYEVIFTAGATDGVNMVAGGCEGTVVQRGDVVLTTLLEHHSNFVPWQELAKRTEGSFVAAPITSTADIDRDGYSQLVEKHRPKVIGITAHSNAFGTIIPVKELVAEGHAVGALVLVDATQAVVHGGIDIKDTQPDFLVFSTHKMYGPTGLGVLIGKKESLERLRPYRTGGGMISRVAVEGATWAELPARLEAGTPQIGEAIAFQATLEELEEIAGKYDLVQAEDSLFRYAFAALKGIPGVSIVGHQEPSPQQRSIISFTIEGTHPHDVASIADSCGVQLRAGHHCCMPGMHALGVQSTVRLSLGLYSTQGDIDKLTVAIEQAKKVFS